MVSEFDEICEARMHYLYMLWHHTLLQDTIVVATWMEVPLTEQSRWARVLLVAWTEVGLRDIEKCLRDRSYARTVWNRFALGRDAASA